MWTNHALYFGLQVGGAYRRLRCAARWCQTYLEAHPTSPATHWWQELKCLTGLHATGLFMNCKKVADARLSWSFYLPLIAQMSMFCELLSFALWTQNEAMDLLIAVLKNFPNCLRQQSINVYLFLQNVVYSWDVVMFHYFIFESMLLSPHTNFVEVCRLRRCWFHGLRILIATQVSAR